MDTWALAKIVVFGILGYQVGKIMARRGASLGRSFLVFVVSASILQGIVWYLESF